MPIQNGIISSSGKGPKTNGNKEYYFTAPVTNASDVLVGSTGNATFPIEPGNSNFILRLDNMEHIEFSVIPPDKLFWISKET